MNYFAFSLELCFQIGFFLLVIRYAYLVRKGGHEEIEKYRNGFFVSTFLLLALTVVTALVFFGRFELRGMEYLAVMSVAILYATLFITFDCIYLKQLRKSMDKEIFFQKYEKTRTILYILIPTVTAFSLLIFSAVISLTF